MSENPLSNIVWEDKLKWFKSSPEYRTLDTTDGEPIEFEWNIFSGFTTLQLCYKVQEFMSKMSIQPEDFTGRILFMSMFNDILWGSKENKKNANQVLNSFRFMQKDFHHEDGLLLNVNHKENVAELMMLNPAKANIQSSDPQVHCPEECSKATVVLR